MGESTRTSDSRLSIQEERANTQQIGSQPRLEGIDDDQRVGQGENKSTRRNRARKRGSGFVSSNELGLNVDEIGASEGDDEMVNRQHCKRRKARVMQAPGVLSRPSSGLRIPPKLRVIVGGMGEEREANAALWS